MAQVKEKTAVEHYKTNDDLNLDYLIVHKHNLEEEKIKRFTDIKVDQEKTLGNALNEANQRLELLEEDKEKLLNEIENLKVEISELKQVFENAIKELITR